MIFRTEFAYDFQVIYEIAKVSPHTLIGSRRRMQRKRLHSELEYSLMFDFPVTRLRFFVCRVLKNSFNCSMVNCKLRSLAAVTAFPDLFSLLTCLFTVDSGCRMFLKFKICKTLKSKTKAVG